CSWPETSWPLAIELRNSIPSRGLRPSKRSHVDRMRVDACKRLRKISLVEKLDGTIPAQPRPHRACVPLRESPLRFNISHGSVRFRMARLHGLRNVVGIGGREKVNMDIVPQIGGCPHFGNFAGAPGLDQIRAEALLLEWAKRICDHKFAEWNAEMHTPIA